MSLLHQATVISMSPVRLVVVAVSQQLLLNVTLSDMQKKSLLSLALATVYRPPGPYTDFLKEFADFLSDLLVNADKALIVGDFNGHLGKQCALSH